MPTLPRLSDRETQLLRYAAHGMTDQAISDRLGISLATIGTYWGRIRIKMGPLNRTELVANYLRAQGSQTLDALRQQNAELTSKLAEETQRADHLSLYEALIQSAPDAILVVNRQGEIQLANEAAAELFGYKRDKLHSMKVSALIPTRFRDAHNDHRETYFEHPERRQMGAHQATVALTADGREIPIAATLNAAESAAGTLVTCIVRAL
jgi:PAS domain S-box-containing protein